MNIRILVLTITIIILTACGTTWFSSGDSLVVDSPPVATLPPVPTPTPTPTPIPPKHLTIVPGDDALGIYISDDNAIQGTHVVSVANRLKHPLFRDFVSLSPDERQVLYVTSEITNPVNVALYTAAVDGSETIRIAEFEDEFWSVAPIWSPDSSQIAYVTKVRGSPPDDGLHLWRMQRDGGNPVLVTAGGAFRPDVFRRIPQGVIRWSKDGKGLEFQDRWSDPPQLFHIDLAHSELTHTETSKDPDVVRALIADSGSATLPCPVPLYNQKNYTDMMYPCAQTISRAGCAVGATSMLLGYYGVSSNPAALNMCLGEQACPLWWVTVAESCSQGSIFSLGFLEPFNYETLDQELAAGRPVIVLVTSSDGTHFVLVTGGGGHMPNRYTIHDPVDGSSNQTLARYTDAGWTLAQTFRYQGQPACPDAASEGSASQTIAYGDILTDTIDGAGDLDDFLLSATQGDYIEIRASSLDYTLDPIVTLYDLNDEYMVHDDDSGGGADALLRGTIPATGHYRLRVQGYGDRAGPYTVQVVRVR